MSRFEVHAMIIFVHMLHDLWIIGVEGSNFSFMFRNPRIDSPSGLSIIDEVAVFTMCLAYNIPGWGENRCFGRSFYSVHKLYNECQELRTGNGDQRFRRIVLGVCSKRLFLPVRTGCNFNTKPKRRFIKIYFHNKGIDKVNLTNKFHDRLVKSKVPIYFQEQNPPLIIGYQCTQNISRSVFNYNQTLYDIDFNNYNITSSSCDCQSCPFRCEPHGHVITGGLRIVKNGNLRRLLEKGPEYSRIHVDWKVNKKILTMAIDDYSKKWSKLEGYRVSVLEEWSETVKLIIKNRISNLQRCEF